MQPSWVLCTGQGPVDLFSTPDRGYHLYASLSINACTRTAAQSGCQNAWTPADAWHKLSHSIAHACSCSTLLLLVFLSNLAACCWQAPGCTSPLLLLRLQQVLLVQPHQTSLLGQIQQSSRSSCRNRGSRDLRATVDVRKCPCHKGSPYVP